MIWVPKNSVNNISTPLPNEGRGVFLFYFYFFTLYLKEMDYGHEIQNN
nr:MAG TPA: hypothetical protein [Caudoviricetes sp.]